MPPSLLCNSSSHILRPCTSRLTPTARLTVTLAAAAAAAAVAVHSDFLAVMMTAASTVVLGRRSSCSSRAGLLG